MFSFSTYFDGKMFHLKNIELFILFVYVEYLESSFQMYLF